MTTQESSSATISTVRLEIAEGPSKFDLLTSLGVWRPERHRVEFTTPDGKVISAVINGVDAEDGSGNCWTIRGSGVHKNNPDSKLRIKFNFDGFYRSGGPGGKGGYLNLKK